MQPLLAALDQGAQRGALSSIADVQGRRHACCCHVVDGLQASSGGAHGFSRGEGGLEGLSLLRLFKGLRELRSVAAGVRGGSALMGSVLLAVWLPCG